MCELSTGNRRRPWAALPDVAEVKDGPGLAACVESSAGRSARAPEGRSALSIWNCALERNAGTRAGVGQTRRPPEVVELIPVVAVVVIGVVERVRSWASGRLPVRGDYGGVDGQAGVPGAPDPVTRCPQPPQGAVMAVMR
jgi:hypothetical protein